MNQWLNQVLIALINFFKTKSPKLFAIFAAAIIFVYALDGQGYVDIPQWIEDILITVGILSGAHTAHLKK